MGMGDPQEHIAYLEARVEALESALAERSRELRKLQRHLSPEDLLLFSRIRAGLPPLPRQAYDLSLWTETHELAASDVEETMLDLWRSLRPIEDPEDDEANGAG